MNRAFAFLVLVLYAMLTGPANAQNTTLVTLDTTDLELVERSPQKTLVTFTIPAVLSAMGVHLQRWNISQDGRLIGRGASKIDFPKPAADGTPELVATFDLSELNASGRYQVTLEFLAPKPPATEIGPGALQQTVQLKLTKPAAELRISTPLRIERTVYFPSWWPFSVPSRLNPQSIILTESSGKSWVKIDPQKWDVVLRRGDDVPSDHPLQVTLPPSIDGWGQAKATINLDGPVPIGTTTGTLTIRAPQLAAQTVDFAVTFVSRITALWLLPIILAGIGLGWYFRDYLEARRGRLTSIIPAEQEVMTLDDLITATADTKYRNDLEITRATLVDKIDEKNGTAETIAVATSKAAMVREAISKAINDLRDKLDTSLQEWSRPGSVEPLPDDVTPVLNTLRDLINRLTDCLNQGLLTEVSKQLNDSVPNLLFQLRDAIGEWLTQFSDLKTTPLEPWSETLLSTKVSGIAAEADMLRQQLTAPDSAEAVWKLLLSTAALLDHFKQDLLGTVREKVLATATLASTTVRKFGSKLGPKADAIEAAAAAIPDKAIAGKRSAASEFTDHLKSLRAVIIDALTAAWNDAAHPLPGLPEGDFSTALAALENKLQTEQALGEEGPVPLARTSADFVAQLARIPDQLTTTALPKWKIVLEASAATVFEPVTVRARLIMPLGNAPPDVTLAWSKAGIPVGQSAPGTFERSFTFAEPGPVSVGVVAIDSLGASDSATLILEVRAVHGARIVASVQNTLENVELLLNIGASAIITVTGWLIFSPTFTGTFPEFFAAFLWGFSVDIGFAKVREITESVKGLKVPIPLPKQT